MIIIFILFCIICLIQIHIKTPVLNSFNENYLSVSRTNSIKGIFILLVFLSHARNYLLIFPEYSYDPLNRIYDIFQNYLGQGVVIMFLFYSGYGVMESIKKKGTNYINAIPKKRFAKTLVNFDIAVIIFILLNLCLSTLKNYTIPKVLLSFIGWESVGNSNWYIFAMLVMYLITFVAFKLSKNKHSNAAKIVTILTVIYIALLALVGKDAWWFDTVLLYPLGIWYSIGKDNIERFIKKKPVNYYLLFILCFGVFVVSHLQLLYIFLYEISQVALCALIVMVTMKVDIHNKILEFLGRNLFEIYILMRIPMIILLHFDVTNTYLFVAISFAVTLLIAALFKKVLNIVDKALLK